MKKIKIELNKVKLIIYDFDGVMTDNRVLLREDGLESVLLNRSDGLAISIIKKLGIKQLIITREKNKVAETRAKKLGIFVVKGIKDKKNRLISFCQINNIELKSVIYIGNDLNDLEAMKIVGYPICPLDAYDEIKKISKIILPSKGGYGVVRVLLKHLKGIKFNQFN